VSGLDEKLKAIVLAGPNGEHGHLSTEEIAQIRQAFESEGYVRHPHGVEDLGQDCRVMTGQEFLRRFEAELDAPSDYEQPEIIGQLELAGHHEQALDTRVKEMRYQLLDAARRAAGIDMATTSPDTTTDLSNPPKEDN
jgi:hypothetical protein